MCAYVFLCVFLCLHCVCVCMCVHVRSTYGHVCGEAGDQRGGDGVGDGGVGVLGLLARGGDDVEADEGVEAGGRALHHLGRRLPWLPIITWGGR